MTVEHVGLKTSGRIRIHKESVRSEEHSKGVGSSFQWTLDRTAWHIDRVLATQYCTWAPLPSWLHCHSSFSNVNLWSFSILTFCPTWWYSYHIQKKTTSSNCCDNDRNFNSKGAEWDKKARVRTTAFMHHLACSLAYVSFSILYVSRLTLCISLHSSLLLS